MGDLIGYTFISDGKSKPISEFNYQMFEGPNVIYEVIRVEEGVPLFFDDYFDRLKNSFSLLNIPHNYSSSYLKQIIKTLLKINDCQSGPIKLLFRYSEPQHFVAHLMQPHVPTAIEYERGVHTILLHKERLNPNAKVWNQLNRNHTIEELTKANAYEGLLVNDKGFITEGSRSNVFFIKNGVVCTTPNDFILPGITRKKVIKLCQLKGIALEMRKIHSSEISLFDSVFLTGTSRKVLPVKTIDTINFSVENDTMQIIISEFEQLVSAYIQQEKRGIV